MPGYPCCCPDCENCCSKEGSKRPLREYVVDLGVGGLTDGDECDQCNEIMGEFTIARVADADCAFECCWEYLEEDWCETKCQHIEHNDPPCEVMADLKIVAWMQYSAGSGCRWWGKVQLITYVDAIDPCSCQGNTTYLGSYFSDLDCQPASWTLNKFGSDLWSDCGGSLPASITIESS